jgi:hypothetical protein
MMLRNGNQTGRVVRAMLVGAMSVGTASLLVGCAAGPALESARTTPSHPAPLSAVRTADATPRVAAETRGTRATFGAPHTIVELRTRPTR